MFAALKEISLPMLRGRPGFLGLLLLRSREDPQEVSYITLWKDTPVMESNIHGKEWQDALKRFEARGFQITQPKVTHYDIIAEEWHSGQ